MRRLLWTTLVLLSCISCNMEKESGSDSHKSATEDGIKFDKAKWALKEGKDYPYREIICLLDL